MGRVVRGQKDQSADLLNGFCRGIDLINEWMGKIVGWLFIPFTILVIMDVITRYVFNSPWYYIDVNIQIMGTIVMLGAGYALLHSGHVRVDVLINLLSPRKQALLEIILFPLFATCIGVLFWKTLEAASLSIELREHYASGLAPPFYPYRIIITLGVLLLLLQGIVNFIRKLRIFFSPPTRGEQ